ncbi:MAG: LysR family transcriptional regulator [Nocardioidaceae bacterium]|nr:LysR family transcriptional regulator [Nocardioidaceae bacterium]
MARLPDLDDLRLLVLVSRSGSLGRTAEELQLSQPSVSRRVARLERALGLSLLQRGPRGTTLTTEGRLVVGWASSLLHAAEVFEESVGALRRQRRGSLRVAASMTIAEHLAPGWITRLRETSPSLAVSLEVHNSTDVAQGVEDGAVDLGFLESRTVRRSLRRRRFRQDRLCVVVAPTHPWARKRRGIDPTALAAEPLLVREPGSGTRETIDDAVHRAGLEISPGLVLASNAALKASAIAGIGPAVLSELAVADELGRGQLVEVPVPGLDLSRPLSVVWRDGHTLPAEALDLLRIAQE